MFLHQAALFLALLAPAQQPSPAPAPAPAPQSDPDAVALTHAYVDQFQASAGIAGNYTFLITHRDFNSIHSKITSDHSRTSEQISIGGLPYVRRLSRDGKPLAGKDLARETEMYETAVRERTGLSESKRNEMRKAQSHSTTIIPAEDLLTAFHMEILGRQPAAGRTGTILLLTPLSANVPPRDQRRIRMVLDERGRPLLYHVEFLVADNGFSQGTTFDAQNIVVGDDLLPQTTRIDTTVHVKAVLRSADIHLIGTDDFTNYRRFRSSATILPSSDTAAAPATPQ